MTLYLLSIKMDTGNLSLLYIKCLLNMDTETSRGLYPSEEANNDWIIGSTFKCHMSNQV